MVPNVPKRNVFAKLPFLGNTLFQIRKKLQKLFSDKLTSCTSPKSHFYVTCRAKNCSIFKDKMLLSGLVYKYMCEVAAIPLIMEKPNAVLKPEVLNI